MNNFKFFNENVLVSSDGLVSQLKGKGKGVSDGFDNGIGYKSKKINGHRWGIHDLVWTVFRGEIPKGYVVHHINHQRDDNRLENLELMPMSEHISLHHSKKIVSEETRQKRAKAVRQIPLDGSPEKVWLSISEAARQLNAHTGFICKCCKGNMKTYKKSKWEYV